MTALRLILGDQLNPQHSWFQHMNTDVIYVLMEVRTETDYVKHHAQKVIAIFAGMRDLARELSAQGHRVHYLRISDVANKHSIPANLAWLCTHYKATSCQYQAPDEYRLDQSLTEFARTSMVPVTCVDSEHFYTSRTEVADCFVGRKTWLMEHFYRHMRTRHRILMADAKQPEGGQWNFDHDNRKSWSGTPAEPSDCRIAHDHSSLWHEIETAGVQTFGDNQAACFYWPLNRREAVAQLAVFIQQRLVHFGDFQDAMNTKVWRLFHSLISFALNTKMLTPQEVVLSAESAWQAGQVPLSAAEGFIRQILGWREYVRGVYWANMPGYDQHNHFQHDLDLPVWFWTGQTRMQCLAKSIGQSLEHAYAHHIQRLMIIGNFSLLAGLRPEALHHWYLGVYIDAFEWVELPNTLGMSQFADGGLLATKPYVSSAAYIDRMSDYCKGCYYDRKARVGDKACPYNALYWDFFARNKSKLVKNPRIGMVYRQLEKMEPAAIEAFTQQAKQLRIHLDNL